MRYKLNGAALIFYMRPITTGFSLAPHGFPLTIFVARIKRAKMKHLDWLHWTLIILIIVMTSFFVATPYQYFIVGSGNTLVRVHRISGETERLSGDGWKRMGGDS
jgi:hypothetical protein